MVRRWTAFDSRIRNWSLGGGNNGNDKNVGPTAARHTQEKSFLGARTGLLARTHAGNGPEPIRQR